MLYYKENLSKHNCQKSWMLKTTTVQKTWMEKTTTIQVFYHMIKNLDSSRISIPLFLLHSTILNFGQECTLLLVVINFCTVLGEFLTLSMKIKSRRSFNPRFKFKLLYFHNWCIKLSLAQLLSSF